METVLIVIHLILVIAMAVVILLQRSEGGALGIGGGGGFMSSRGTGNVLTRTTAILAAGFFLTSIALTILANFDSGSSVLDRVPGAENNGGIQPIAPLQPAPATPEIGPQVPKAE